MNTDKGDNQTVFKGEDGQEEKTSSGLDQNIAGLLCYLAWFITGIVFLVLEKENKFIRFHAMQSIIVFVVLFVLNIILTAIPIIGWGIGLLLIPVYLILWLFLMWKAYQNKWFKLPIVGDIAEKQVNKVG